MTDAKIGIYCIENLINNKKYFGQSVDVDKRLKKHQYLLKNKKHNNEHLQRAYDIYSYENFKFYLIEECNIDLLDEREIYYISLYNIWSMYDIETEGVVIAYASIYGNTKKAVEYMKIKLEEYGVKTIVHDLARTDMHEAVADAFRYSKLVLASSTYNADVFPPMKEYINHLIERNYQNRKGKS